MMKNIGASAGAVSAQVDETKKEEAEEGANIEEEEYTEHQNEMYFHLREHPEYRIYATGRWLENNKGEVVGDADTYFRHVMTGSRCDSVRECLDGWSEQDEEAEEIWETLSMRIEKLDGLEQIICDEESFGV